MPAAKTAVAMANKARRRGTEWIMRDSWPRPTSILLATVGALLPLLVTSHAGASSPPEPIPQDPGASSVRPFLGHARPAHPLAGARFAPRHPFMAPNNRSNLHDDAYQSDAGTVPGPLGYSPKVSSTFFAQDCASVTFDSRGRILTVCVGLVNVTLRLLDPTSLATLA